jgi:ATP-dependent Lon protease
MAIAKHTLPTIVLQSNTLTLPHITTILPIGRSRSLNALSGGQNSLIFTTLKSPDGVHEIGTVGRILEISSTKARSVRNICFEGLYRARIQSITETDKILEAVVSPCEYTPEDPTLILGHRAAFLNALEELSELSNNKFIEVLITLHKITDHEQLVYTALHYLDIIRIDLQYEILATSTLSHQFTLLTDAITKQTTITDTEQKINQQIHKNTAAKERKQHLESKLHEIQQMLGNNEDGLRDKINKSSMPDDIRQRAQEELSKLSQLTFNPAEASISKAYLERLLALPWGKYSPNTITLKQAKEILEREHCGLTKIKDFILDYIAVADRKCSQIICLYGPPGTGKTSLAKSIAKAMGKEFTIIPLGGVRDESEIRGHRRTYLGAMPGKIITTLSKCRTMNPVILLDEVDKIAKLGHTGGDPEAALLEVLDPNQNHHFQDHYMDIGIDLSQVTFIATANCIADISQPLFNRMEEQELSSYSFEQKIEIAKTHLLPKIAQNLCPTTPIRLTQKALQHVAAYTKEAGIRKLEKALGQIVRRTIRRRIEQDQNQDLAQSNQASLVINLADVRKYLGSSGHRHTTTTPQIGCTNGLAWTPNGGVLLPVQVSIHAGGGQNAMTGALGKVMKESAMIAKTLASKYLALHPEKESTLLNKSTIHLHVPEGGIKKDGPSAGITIMITLLSELFQIPVSHTLAMTGEIDLRGNVLPVGGVREKVLAGHREGIKRIILPDGCQYALEDVPSQTLAELEIHYVSNVNSAILIALPELAKQLALRSDLIPVPQKSDGKSEDTSELEGQQPEDQDLDNNAEPETQDEN